MVFLIDIGTTIVAKLAEYTIEPVIRQVGYVICYNKNFKKLQTRVGDLGGARDSMENDVKAEERKGKKIEKEVQDWLTKVGELTNEAAALNDKHLAQTKCLHGFCPNLKLRHHLSRKSTKLVLEVAELHEKRNNFAHIAYDASTEMVCIQNYEALDSRTSTAMAVINELRNSNTYMIGVYGIGGVGKTTLVKEVNNQLATSGEKLFDEVVMIRDLKHDPSIERIQKEMAEKLGLELPENGTPAGRAHLISNRIKDKKTLVILDDVWESIDLEAVGLPRMATIKILLTSRSKLVLAQDMGTQKDFPLEVLNEEESWRLFQKMAGDIFENPDIKTIATQVAERCGGLPLLIVTVARSLKDSPLYDWKDTFRRLKNFDGKGLEDKTYAAIEWSYDKLNSEELKSVFLLCESESGSANEVYILDLLKYSMGLGFIKNVDTMEEARDALNSLLKKLQHSCLLLDTGNNGWVRIHDLVKHVAKHIAARDHHVLSVSYGSELKEWPDMEFCEKCTTISLMYCQTPELPQVLQCPELTMFHLSSVDVDSREIPSKLFKEMKKLKVLDLTKRSIASLPPSLKFLKDLQTLCLDQCMLEDIALVGELKNLKILSFLQSKFKELPEEIGQLTRLQLLDLTDCSQLEVVSPDVISKLKRLEELRMGKNSFNKWEAGRVGETKRSNASLEELTYLPRLTALHIHIPDATILPANLFTTSKLERFQICIGSVWKWDDVDEALNALKLKLTSYNELDQGLKMLLKNTQDLYVEGMEDVNDKFFRELATGGYQQLKHLHVQNNAKFAYTINEKVGFPNLTWLAVSELKSLRFLLSSSMARSLSQVKRLQISGCQFMEVVISIEESNKELAENFFPQLQDLELNGLPNLTKFCSTCERLEDCTESAGICEEVGEIDSKGNLDFVIQHFLFENKGEFPNMKKLSLNGLAKLTTIWNNKVSLGSSKNLETIEIVSCGSLKSVFPASVAKSLQQLSRLKVQNCGVEEIISKEDDVQTTPMFVFSKLTYVRFENLPQLKSFYPGLHYSECPSLLTLLVYGCTKVQIFAKGIPELKNPCTPNEQFLFLLEKDSLPNLETLGFGIMENWDSPPLHLLRNLKYLYSYAHTNDSSLISLEQLLGLEKVNGEIHAAGDATFPFLREWHLHGMRKLMNLGDDSFGSAGLYFPKVEILELEDCDSLQNLRSSTISFNNLTTLQVSHCKGLKYLISISMAKSLMQLTKLEVRDCEEMIEIVASSGNDVARNEIEFKMLKHLELSALPSLRGFCSGTHTVKFPSLENLCMTGCTQLEGFILDVTTDKNRLANEIKDIESARLMQRFLFDNKVELPKLTSLSLEGLTKLTTIWNKQIQNTSAAPFDCENLKYVEIYSCENLENIFPLWVARNLQQLQTLIVKNCGVKEIVAREERLQTVFKFVFPKVTLVLFWNLSELINFYPGMHVCSWPLLNDLGVFNCNKVDIFAEEFSSFQEKLDGNSSSTLTNRQFLFSIEKDSFPNLERLGLNAMEFSNGPLPAAAQFFGKLKKLEVCCPESKSLVFLDKLLLDPEGSSTASAVGITTQQFPHLKELSLVRMKKLMHLGQDDEEDNSQSATRIPNIPNLQTLFANACDSLRNLRSSAISFDNLTTLQASVCNRLEYLITYSMANSLTQLTTLEVEGCPRLVQIVGSNDEDDSRNEITLPRLKHLKLSVLPRLQSFCSGNCLAKLPSLETSTMSNRLKLKIFAADDQTLQLITNEGDDTDVDDLGYPAEE
uniref:uncharacterized protein LOC105350266 isoform X3 n=1 Tax=Fragaria vesca subsp. vesca TaxID=101020 RepID=UPI0005C88807|nr:PREDICTED: uncharacterized protein LOC105350266 isoform X3 [Fragaria vesca subsp. vesca]